jgi:hypothetical protein
VPKAKREPCLIRDNGGGETVLLRKGFNFSRGFPSWRCTHYRCPLKDNPRSEVEKDNGVRVKLDTVGRIHGIVRCEGPFKVERQ